MELAAGLVTAVAGLLALLSRFNALTSDGRAVARLKADIGVWQSMPRGPARKALGKYIEDCTQALLNDRERDRTVAQGWALGTAWLFFGWLALVSSTAVPTQSFWGKQLEYVLQLGGILLASIGTLLLLLVLSLVVWKVLMRVVGWWRRRGRAGITPDSTE